MGEGDETPFGAGEFRASEQTGSDSETESLAEWERKISQAMNENIMAELVDPTMAMVGPKEVSIYDCILDAAVGESRNISEFTTAEKRCLLKIAADWVRSIQTDDSARLRIRIDRYSVADGGETAVEPGIDFNPDDLFDIHFVIDEPRGEEPATALEAGVDETVSIPEAERQPAIDLAEGIFRGSRSHMKRETDKFLAEHPAGGEMELLLSVGSRYTFSLSEAILLRMNDVLIKNGLENFGVNRAESVSGEGLRVHLIIRPVGQRPELQLGQTATAEAAGPQVLEDFDRPEWGKDEWAERWGDELNEAIKLNSADRFEGLLTKGTISIAEMTRKFEPSDTRQIAELSLNEKRILIAKAGEWAHTYPEFETRIIVSREGQDRIVSWDDEDINPTEIANIILHRHELPLEPEEGENIIEEEITMSQLCQQCGHVTKITGTVKFIESDEVFVGEFVHTDERGEQIYQRASYEEDLGWGITVICSGLGQNPIEGWKKHTTPYPTLVLSTKSESETRPPRFLNSGEIQVIIYSQPLLC